jgi:hypothetical protein
MSNIDPNTLKLLRPFTFHGVEFRTITDTGQAIGECPFTGKQDKFYVNVQNLLWDSKTSGLSGNLGQFFYHVGERNFEMLKESSEAQKKLAVNRKLPRSAFLDCRIGFDGRFYTIPVRNGSNKSLVDLRIWKPGGKILSTPRARAGLFGSEALFDQKRREEPVYICEGEWDAIALRWLLKTISEEGITVAVPGADVFKPEWALWFKDRDVVALYDADEAGARGEKKAYDSLKSIAATMRFVCWPADVPDGFDVRDWVVYGALKKQTPRTCWRRLKLLFEENDHPQKRGEKSDVTDEKKKLTPIEHGDLYVRYKKWLHLTNEDALAILFGTCLANKLEGDPLWLFIVAPPGGMKSELIMTLGDCDDIEAVSSVTPHALVSGANLSGGGDPSLIPKLNGKVLAIKDFTTILQAHPNVRDEIFGQLRDCYDGKFEKMFGNGVLRKYNSKFGIVAGVTPSIDAYASLSQGLGERFLKYRMDGNLIHQDEAERILRAIKNVNKEVSMRKDLLSAAARFMARKISVKQEDLPTIDEVIVSKIVSLAMLVSRMRGVVNRDKYNTGLLLSKASYEIGTRLAKQFTKLAVGVALYHGSKAVTETEYRLVAKVALDSTPDRIEELVRILYYEEKLPKDSNGLRTKEILACTKSSTMSTVYRTLQDLSMIGVVDQTGTAGTNLWRLASKVKDLIVESSAYA